MLRAQQINHFEEQVPHPSFEIDRTPIYPIKKFGAQYYRSNSYK